MSLSSTLSHKFRIQPITHMNRNLHSTDQQIRHSFDKRTMGYMTTFCASRLAALKKTLTPHLENFVKSWVGSHILVRFESIYHWSNYSDLTRPYLKRWPRKGNRKSRLVKYHNLATHMFLRFSWTDAKSYSRLSGCSKLRYQNISQFGGGYILGKEIVYFFQVYSVCLPSG